MFVSNSRNPLPNISKQQWRLGNRHYNRLQLHLQYNHFYRQYIDHFDLDLQQEHHIKSEKYLV